MKVNHTNLGCILGIETSCDETAVAVYDQDLGVVAEEISGQDIHSRYGGTVPELAAREHLRKISALIRSAVEKAHGRSCRIVGVAYTAGPGLTSALTIGASVGRSLAYAWKVPAAAINHVEGHILSSMLERGDLRFPFLALIASGKHTQLVSAIDLGVYRLLGKSVDDSVGEAFDKTANMLGLSYPGGKKLSNLARIGEPGRYRFPRPMMKNPSLNFSFSGLKTFVKNFVKGRTDDRQFRADVAKAFEEAVVEVLTFKCEMAIDLTGLSKLAMVGGVSSNQTLRSSMDAMVSRKGGELFCVSPRLCTDNGTMIAYAGMLRMQRGDVRDDLSISVRPNWSVEDVTIPR